MGQRKTPVEQLSQKMMQNFHENICGGVVFLKQLQIIFIKVGIGRAAFHRVLLGDCLWKTSVGLEHVLFRGEFYHAKF